MGKRRRDAAAAAHPSKKQKKNHEESEVVAPAEPVVLASVPIGRALVSPRWTNRQRTLVFSSRGVSYRARHLMNDLRSLMPHSKKDAKMDRKDRLHEIVPEICDLKNCNNCVYFEMRKKQDLYMWVAKMPGGPSAKFLVENVHTLEELKLTGNCLKGSRPLLSFDESFDASPEYRLMKEILFQAFATPQSHPKSKPFVDHIMSFFILDNRVWFRNYQVAWGDKKADTEDVLTEVGPRFVLNPIRIFGGSFGGPTLYENPHYISPNERRRLAKLQLGGKYKDRKFDQSQRAARQSDLQMPADEVEDVFYDAHNPVMAVDEDDSGDDEVQVDREDVGSGDEQSDDNEDDS